MNITQLLTDNNQTYDFGSFLLRQDSNSSRILCSDSLPQHPLQPQSPLSFSLVSDSYGPTTSPSRVSCSPGAEDMPLRVSRDVPTSDSEEDLGVEIIVDQDQEKWITVNQLAQRLERTQNNIKRSLANKGIFTRKASRRELKCLSSQLLRSSASGSSCKKTRSINLVHFGSVHGYLRGQISKLDKKKKGYQFFNKFSLTKASAHGATDSE